MYTVNQLEEIISFSEQKLQKAPKGTLFVKHINGIDRYYCGESSESATYLGKNQLEQIKAYQEKAYYKELKKTAEKELVIIRKIQKLESKIRSAQQVYFDMPENKRNFISPYVSAAVEEAKNKIKKECKYWEREKTERKGVSKSINLTTLNGERVRSKSELIIADRLEHAGIPYYYEGKFIFEDYDLNRKKGADESGFDVWFPDFQVLNTRTGELLFWEHFGMMDNSEYCASAQFKIETYAKHGFVMGKNLIVTMESSQHTLNVAYVDKLIEEFLK